MSLCIPPLALRTALNAARVPVGTASEALHAEQVRDDARVVSGVGAAVESPMLHQVEFFTRR